MSFPPFVGLFCGALASFFLSFFLSLFLSFFLYFFGGGWFCRAYHLLGFSRCVFFGGVVLSFRLIKMWGVFTSVVGTCVVFFSSSFSLVLFIFSRLPTKQGVNQEACYHTQRCKVHLRAWLPLRDQRPVHRQHP